MDPLKLLTTLKLHYLRSNDEVNSAICKKEIQRITVYADHHCFHSKPPNFKQVANLWNPLNTMTIELCSITWASVQRQVVELESRYITLSMNRDSKYSNQLPLEYTYTKLLLILVEKGHGLSGQLVVLLMNENFDRCTVSQKIYTTTTVSRPT